VDETRIPLLRNIENVDDLRRLGEHQLPVLADELRQFLIHEISERGGHFGANLGVVELSIALHYVFQTPRDALVWDVGHQAYAHKILTGRRHLFAGNRTFGGISGFPSRSESIFDCFGTGHASTSISATIGIAHQALSSHSSPRPRSIAVIGDGALTGGLAYEALNQLCGSNLPILIVVNDNQMSIDPNVGGMSKHLVRLKNDQSLEAANSIFNQLGIPYTGRVDGHNLTELIVAFRAWNDNPKPSVIHVITRKGKGFPPAEEEQTRWHAPGRFDKLSGQSIPERQLPGPKFQDVFGQTLLELAKADQRVVGITAAMLSGTSLKMMKDQMPDRCFDVGIAEAHAVTFSAGMASQGARPFVAIYSTFLQRAYDQIIHDVALQKLPVVFCVDRAGLAGADGPTHHGAFDMAYLSCIPNLTIAAPRNAKELRLMMYTALKHDSGPFVIRYPRGHAPDRPDHDPVDSLMPYTAHCLVAGSSGMVISVGPMASFVSDALNRLDRTEDIAHWDLRFVKPIDPQLLHHALSHPFVLVVEDGCHRGGSGSAIGHALLEAGYRGKFKVAALPDAFVTHGSPDELYALHRLDATGIFEHLQALLSD
jgi:1-deoxy-D-xylulose-5-phosphate synthase